MRVFYSDKNDFDISDGTVIALGNFDGLHKAHMKLLYETISYAEEKSLKAGIHFFSDNPKTILSGKIEPDQITPVKSRLQILKTTEIDFAYIQTPTKEFLSTEPEIFVQMLVEKLNVKYIVVGYHYRFGANALGNPTLLKKLGQKYGFGVCVVGKVSESGEVVSSTNIRKFLKSGDVIKSNLFLGRDYFVTGEVVYGKQNGRKLGFPTLNVEVEKSQLLPHDGVYATSVIIDGIEYAAVTNIGKNPTFNAEKTTVESHLPGYNSEIYGKVVTVNFKEKIRGEKRFKSVDELKEQIAKDIEFLKKIKNI